MTEDDAAIPEPFDRWWKQHGIHKQGLDPALVASYCAVAHAAWWAALGTISKSVRDDRIERLEQRAQYLRMKIFNDRPHTGDFKRGELSALEWAIPIVVRATEMPTKGDTSPS